LTKLSLSAGRREPQISDGRCRLEWMALFGLQKRVASITGGIGGIDLRMAKDFASCGAAVVIAGRNEAKAQSALRRLCRE
jgi:3-keto-L-gulonate-6-phosphate decarboxylase